MSKANYNRTSEEIEAEVRRGGGNPTNIRIGPGSDGPVDEVGMIKYARKVMDRRDGVDKRDKGDIGGRLRG
jgi:hypothetical protein